MPPVQPRSTLSQLSSPERRSRSAEALEAGAFEPFGWLPVADTDPRDALHHLEFEWSDSHVNVIAHRADEIPRSGGVVRCTEMFRHDTHTQALLVLDVPCVLAVAEPTVRFTSAGDAAAIRAFRLEPLDAVVLHRGTWHWGPHPLHAGEAHLFNVQGWRYLEDNTRADLDAVGAAVDILVGGF